ncbi:MAG: mobile mystery protein A [Dokdonella sp.]
MPSPSQPSTAELARLRLDAKLEPLSKLRDTMAVPRGGWLRAVRQALGMTLDDLAVRVDATGSTVMRLERSEQKGTIQLDSLRRIAAAMNCEVAYVLLPKDSLQQTVAQQREKVARNLNRAVNTHMKLEGQHVEDAAVEKWRKDHAVALVPDSKLWKDRL